MTLARVSLSLIGVVGVIAIALAGATIWLLVSQPIATADAAADLARGNVSPIAKALAGVLYEALQGLLKYL
jgi:multidrug resistance efflux pump